MDVIHPGVVVYVAYANGRSSVLTDLKRWECQWSMSTFIACSCNINTLLCFYLQIFNTRTQIRILSVTFRCRTL